MLGGDAIGFMGVGAGGSGDNSGAGAGGVLFNRLDFDPNN